MSTRKCVILTKEELAKLLAKESKENKNKPR
jgi:hypothetical protein